jgi:hypothetical protein
MRLLAPNQPRVSELPQRAQTPRLFQLEASDLPRQLHPDQENTYLPFSAKDVLPPLLHPSS